MKKITLLFAAFCGIVLAANAQLKVDSVGKVYIQRSNIVNNASLNVGSNPNSDIEENYDEDTVFGINVQKHDSGQKDYCIGILSEANLTRTNGYAIGVWGHGTGTVNNNFGVLGTIHPYHSGAGICGTTEGGCPPPFQGFYAGYFYGDTYVEGSLTATGIYNLSDMRLKENVVSLSQTATNEGGILGKLQGLDVISYNLKRRSETQTKRADMSDSSEGSALQEWKKKDKERRHYGVSAQELQKIFPDLVREGQDGYLTVSYTEMVPILLRCIQELKQEIDELKNASDNNVEKSRGMSAPITNDEETTGVRSSAINGATLKQNTPNPFTERTTISFTLPEDAQNAYIYIFDMQGKMQKQIPVNVSMQSVSINGYELSAGMYIYSLVINGQEIDTKRMILSK